MRLIRKRAIAMLIDFFIYALFFVPLIEYVDNLLGDKSSIVYFILLIPFFAKDCLFKNCSFGKKIIGLSIYKSNWEKATPFELIKRSLLTIVFSYIIGLKAILFGETPEAVFDWELNKLKMVVVENKIYNKMKEVALEKNCNFEKEMTAQYEQYIYSLCNE